MGKQYLILILLYIFWFYFNKLILVVVNYPPAITPLCTASEKPFWKSGEMLHKMISIKYNHRIKTRSKFKTVFLNVIKLL